MAEKQTEKKINIPTNEEIIDELTKDLESNCVTEESKTNTAPIEVEFDDDQSENSDSNNIEDKDDFIDEEYLKDLEVTLNNDEKELRKHESTELKNIGNNLFKNGDYLESLRTYTKGLNTCPLSYPIERSILYSNRAAAKAKLARTQSAIEDCSEALKLNEHYIRALLRRAQLYEQSDKLDEALEDYKKILELDPGVVEARRATVNLPPKIEQRNEKMKEEMLGKLKDLGNLFLKPFGLSTDNFQLQQDPNTGGYSVNFQQKK